MFFTDLSYCLSVIACPLQKVLDVWRRVLNKRYGKCGGIKMLTIPFTPIIEKFGSNVASKSRTMMKYFFFVIT